MLNTGRVFKGDNHSFRSFILLLNSERMREIEVEKGHVLALAT